jgi:non-ribosomal peptide synthetase component F
MNSASVVVAARTGDQGSVALGKGSERPYPRDATVDELFAAHAARTPHAVALVFGEESLTYGQLEAHANSVASSSAGEEWAWDRSSPSSIARRRGW